MSVSIDEERVTVTEKGDILLDGDLIGHISWNENVLVDMAVDENYQSQGIGTIAIQQMVSYIIGENPSVETITTTTVVSGAMGTALKRAGFEEHVVEKPIMSTESFSKDVEAEEIPTEEEINYTYYVSKD